MDFWIELSTYYTELSLVWKLIACGTGLLAAGAAAYILKQRETETVFGRPAKGRIAAVGLLVMYMMLVLASTVFDRKPGRNYQYEWELFWTWRAVFEGRTGLIREIFYNLLMLFPYGCLLPAALGWTSGRKSGEALSEN